MRHFRKIAHKSVTSGRGSHLATSFPSLEVEKGPWERGCAFGSAWKEKDTDRGGGVLPYMGYVGMCGPKG